MRRVTTTLLLLLALNIAPSLGSVLDLQFWKAALGVDDADEEIINTKAALDVKSGCRFEPGSLKLACSWIDPPSGEEPLNTNEDEAKEFLRGYNDLGSVLENQYALAQWKYTTDLSDAHSEALKQISLKNTEFSAKAIKEASKFDTKNFSEDTKRQFKNVGKKSMSDEDEEELATIKSKMGEIYASSKVCVKEDDCLNLEPGLSGIMADSRNSTERLFVWNEWRRNVGQKVKPLYERFIELKNKKSVLNGYTDLGDEWRSRYETETFRQDIADLYSELQPLYRELHTYVRRKLYETYGGDVVDLRGPLPAHLLGDMWGRFWNNLYEMVEPFKGKPAVNPSPAMKQQNYTVLKMFQTGDDFYASMGLKRVPSTFWDLSMLTKPTDGREVLCHATAWDFSDGKDFRIRMCARDGSFEDLNTIHHELGHIQYYQQYKHLPSVYRDGANDGFHEAIGELMAMAGATPKHLYSIGLLDELVEDEELDLNFLMSQALITISTLPFHLTNDMWRWKIFGGEVATKHWNTEYWKMKEEIVGVKAPVERTEADLDPPALYHVNQDWDMMRYFTRTILQFQFAEALCDISGHEGEFHRCDFSGSKEAGSALARMLSLGSSKPWPDALESLTGERKMSARPILKFFSPLYKWLKKINVENGDTVGWDSWEPQDLSRYRL